MKLVCLLGLLCVLSGSVRAEEKSGFELATFQADVTPPVGHMLLTGSFKIATGITSTLEARGFVLRIPKEKPLVVCSVDWSEIRNETYDQWRDQLADAAGTTRERVLVSSIHQHDTPMGDLGAERVLKAMNSPHQVMDPKFHEEALGRVVAALRESLKKMEPVTHIGLGKAKVEKIASNRRYELPDGSVHYNRMSACKILTAQRAGEGAIDPFLKSLSFWKGDRALVVYNLYATHPMSFYGTSKVDADFPGLAREKRQDEMPGTLQIYASGCSGNVTAGKYNTGAAENRPVLAERLYQGMKKAFESAEKHELSSVSFRNEKLALTPRKTAGFGRGELEKIIREKEDARSHLMASLGLSWLDRVEKSGSAIDVPSISFNEGKAQIVLLPGEIYVDYQIFAQSLAPDRFVMTPGYGECAPGYIPLEMHWAEKDSNLKGWCWVAEGMEAPIKEVLRKLIAE